MSEHSRLVILAAALRGLSSDFNSQFNALADDTPADAVLKALDCVESSLQEVGSSARLVVLYASHTPPLQGRRPPQHQCPPQPDSTCSQRLPTIDCSKYCLLHNMHRHSLAECQEAACQNTAPWSAHNTALAAMAATAVTAASSLPDNAPHSAVLAAMTAAAAAARPHDFVITPAPDFTTNKPASAYTVFSLVLPVHLPTIADTGATQHTTNWRDLLHDFVLLHPPSCLVCANGSHIECVGHGTMCGTVTIGGLHSPVTIQNVAYIPHASHTLISPQQLINASCHLEFDQQHRFQFFLNHWLRLFSYHSSNLYYFPITFTPTIHTSATCLSTASLGPPPCLDLIHQQLGHASERRCHEFVWQSGDLSKHDKQTILKHHSRPTAPSASLANSSLAASAAGQRRHTLHVGNGQATSYPWTS